jgi:predicted nucleic acid-binding protein
VISFDSNILIYAADNTVGERHLRAAGLIERSMRLGNCVQTLQSLGEFFTVATSKAGIAPNRAAAFIEGWCAVILVEPSTAADLSEAIRAAKEHRLPFWDAMLWATARRIGVRVLISEDLQDGRMLGGVRFVDPFASHNSILLDQLLQC